MKSNNSRIINQQRESKFNKKNPTRKKIFNADINKNNNKNK